MPVSVLIGHLILLAAQLCIGVALGWTLWCSRESKLRGSDPQPRDLRRAISLLHQMTTSISDDVRAHSSRIDSGNKQLVELMEEGGDAGEIVAVLLPLIESNQSLQDRLAHTEDELERRATELNRQMTEARTDALTGLLNRRGFDEDFASLLEETEQQSGSLFVLLLDVDHFKSVNDSHGHDAGDSVLRETARVIAGSVRSVDSPARFGGEEFVVLIPHADFDDARHIAAQIRRAVEANTVRIPGGELNVTVSIGVAQWNYETADVVLKRVDIAMYAAKNAGRNRVYFHDGEKSVLIDCRIVESAGADARGRNPFHDEVTGLPTRAAFVDELSRRFSEAERSSDALSLTVYGIDNLAEIGANYDEHTADLVRRGIAQFLVNLSRDMDLVASVDVEEFAVLLPGCARTEAHKIAERVRRAASGCRLQLPGGELLPVTISAGVADRHSGQDPEAMLTSAQSAATESRKAAGELAACVDSEDRNSQAVGV